MTDSILIVGGGVAGLTAALECTRAGARAIVVEAGPVVGGRLAAAMTEEGSVAEGPDPVAMPTLTRLRDLEALEIMTLSGLERIDGRPGNFDVSIRERARFVTDACTRCNHCRPVCPVVRPNEYDEGLSYRKAIYAPLPEALPPEFVIDIDACLNTPPNYLPCNRCTEVCDDDAIRFDEALDRFHSRQVGAVVIAAGLSRENDSSLAETGYGMHPDIVTAAELERMLTAPGPTGGFVARPSNEEYPESILLILDELTPYAASAAAGLVPRLVSQDIDRIELLITTQPAESGGTTHGLPGGTPVNWGLLQKLEPSDDGRIAVAYADFADGGIPEGQYDMVVLIPDPRPAPGLDRLAEVLDCRLGENGFIDRPEEASPCATSAPGIYVAGGAGGTAVLRDAVAEAGAAAVAALGDLDPRLLNADFAAVAQKEAAAAGGLTEDEIRARIESALHALLQRGNAG